MQTYPLHLSGGANTIKTNDMNLFINPIKYWKEASEYSESYYDYWKIVRFIVDTFTDQLKYAWQRAWRGYDDPELWNHHSTHNERMIEILQWYRDNRFGSPTINDQDFNNCHEVWDCYLDRMIAGFESAEAISYHEYDEGELDFYLSVMEDGLDIYSEYYLGLWD